MSIIVTAASIPQLATITGVTQDPNSDLLYIATTSGYVFTWSETAQSFVSHFDVGRPLSSIDISADGKTLAVGEYSGNLNEYGGSGVTSVGLLTLSNNNIRTLTLGQTATSEGGVVGVGWDASGDLLVATDGQWIPYHFIPAGSQSFGAATVAGSSSLSGASFIETTLDHRYVLVLEGNITGAPLQLYDTQAGKIVAQTTGYQLGTQGFNVGTGDINDNVGLIADVVGGSVLTLDFSLQHAAGPGTNDDIIGAHFNASGNTLYLWDATSNSILIYDTATWLETGSIALSISAEQPSGGPLQPSGEMSLSEDGRYLVLLTGSGFDSIDLSTEPVIQTGNGLGDTLTGTSHANTFIAVRGTNNFVGTGSENTVKFDLPFADYSMTRQADNSLMVSSLSASEGPDHLTNIQYLQFADGTTYDVSKNSVASTTVTNNAGVQVSLQAPLANSTVQGAGSDILDLSANPIASSSTAYTIASNHDGSFNINTNGSSDHVAGVIQVAFTDKTVTVAESGTLDEYTALLYQGALGRTPDAAGLAGWDKIANALPAATQALGVYGLSDASGNYNGALSLSLAASPTPLSSSANMAASPIANS